jgi:serine/threonine protein kinase
MELVPPDAQNNIRRVSNGSKIPREEDERVLTNMATVEIKEKIGYGASGSVFQGFYKDQKVAIKVLDREDALSDQIYRSFVKEGKLMLKLCSKKHQNFVQVHAICISKQQPAIIMEYAELGTLAQVLRTGPPLGVNMEFSLIMGISRGIQFLHKKDVIHRDIAARNILLNSDMVPMIADFGLSREVVSGEEYSSTGADSLPLKWMAPEAIKSSHFTKSTDIWSFGIVIWEIASQGKEPHEEIEVMEAKIQIRDYFLTPAMPSNVDPTMAVIMTQCWYKDPDMRPSPKDIIDMAKERDL